MTSREKVVHRNLLLPVSFLPAGDDDILDSNCSCVVGSGECEPAVPTDVQDSETKTIDWLMHMDDASNGDMTAIQPDCSPMEDVSAPPSEADVPTVPDAVSEILNASDFSVHAGQLSSPVPTAVGVVSMSQVPPNMSPSLST